MESENIDGRTWNNPKKELLAKFSKIIDSQDEIIKNFFHENFSNDNNTESILSTIKIGDIIWAKRYNTEQEKEAIPEGHQEGPYIILGIMPEGFIACPGTSTTPKEEVYDRCIQFNNEYLLPKHTYFKMFYNHFVSNDSFIYKIDALTNMDRKKLLKELKVKKCSHFVYENKIEKLIIPIEIGDIIQKQNKIYLIISEETDKLLCLPLNNYNKNENCIDLKSLDFNKLMWINKNDKNYFIDFINNTKLNAILKKYREHLDNFYNQATLQRGSIVIYDTKYYYIYGECGSDWLMFEISKTNIDEFDELIIKNEKFYTNYKNTLTVPKNSKNLKPILLATQEEIDKIKNDKKSYASRHKKDDEKIAKKKSTKIGYVIKNRRYPNERFIIKSISATFYECLSINDLRYSIYRPYVFEKKEVKACPNTNLSGIVWIKNHPDFNFKNFNDVVEEVFKAQTYHNQQNIKRGSIISINYKYYYVYSENETSWLVREISKDYNEEYKQEKINQQDFYVDYNNIFKILKDVSLPISSNDVECISGVVKKVKK